MSASSEPSERLAQIFQEILALSDSRRTSQLESVSDSDSGELHDGQCVEEQPQKREEEQE